MGIFRRKKECHGCYFFDMDDDICDVFNGECRLWAKRIRNSEDESCAFRRSVTPIKNCYETCQFCGAFRLPEVRKIRDRTWGLVIDVARCPECKRIIDSGVKKAHATDKWRDK
ncbi:hypothetical protein KKH23_07910 [Patescibacteria group bacterium]|nr:hypothetical protein [Patescibacteria group bacterium]